MHRISPELVHFRLHGLAITHYHRGVEDAAVGRPSDQGHWGNPMTGGPTRMTLTIEESYRRGFRDQTQGVSAASGEIPPDLWAKVLGLRVYRHGHRVPEDHGIS